MKKLTLDTFVDYRFVSEPSISPDGKFTAFVAQQADMDNNGYKGNLYLLCNESGEMRQLTAMGDCKSFLWTGDETILFAAMRNPEHKKIVEGGEELTCFYEINVKGGEAVEVFTLPLNKAKLTKLDGTKYLVNAVFDYNRPDFTGMDAKTKKATLERMKDEQRYNVIEEAPFWSNGKGYTSRLRNRLYIYDRANGSLEAITAPLFNTASVDVADGKILYTGVEFDSMMNEKSGIYVYDLATGASKCLVEPGKYMTSVAKLWNGKAVVNSHDCKAYGEHGYTGFSTIDLATGEMKLLAAYDACIGKNSVGSDAKLGGGNKTAAAGDKFYFITTNGHYSYLKTIDASGKISEALTKDGAVESFDVFGDLVMFVGMRGMKLGEIYSLKNGAETQLTHFNDFIAAEYSLSVPEAMTFTAKDGYEIQGWIMKPVDYEAGKKYPAILNIHGGPRTVYSDTFFNEMQVWANKGYFVFYCNPRGSDGRGNEFADICGKYGTVDYDNLMEFTDEVLKRTPDIDADRLGVAGGSYGGFMCNWMIGHTDRFKAAASQRSISNWISFEGTSDIGYHFGPDQQNGRHAYDAEKLWNQSPLKYANKAKTPTLFINSDQDYRCWLAEGISMFTALKYHGVEARMCMFKGENHELSRSGRPYSRIKRMEEICAWFDGHL